MKNPKGEIVYYVTADVLYSELISYFPPVPCGSSTYYIIIADPLIQVPSFPDQGSWSLNLVVCDEFAVLGWEQKCATVFTYRFIVGESGIWENLFAPIYLTYGGMPVTGWGKFSYKLPISIGFILSIVGIILFFLISLRIIFGSIRLGLKELREAPVHIFKKKNKGGKKRNVKT